MTQPIRGRKWVPTSGTGPLAELKTAIRDELRADGATQADLAWFLGRSEKHVSQVLTGKVAGSWDLLAEMAAAVGLSVVVGRDGAGLGVVAFALLPEGLVALGPLGGVVWADEPPAADLLGVKVAAPDLALDGVPAGRRVGECGDFGGGEHSRHEITITGLRSTARVRTVALCRARATGRQTGFKPRPFTWEGMATRPAVPRCTQSTWAKWGGETGIACSRYSSQKTIRPPTLACGDGQESSNEGDL